MKILCHQCDTFDYVSMCYLLSRYGAKNVTLSKLVPTICKMLDDPSIPVNILPSYFPFSLIPVSQNSGV